MTDVPVTSSPINPASVPQRSVFRYPGGKSWLVPHVRAWLGSVRQRPAELVEPFAGGASVGLAAAAERLVDHVTLIESDPDVAVVWEVIVDGDADGLADAICSLRFTADNVDAIVSGPAVTDVDRALRTIVRNRVQRGGVLAPRAGRLQAGERGRGLSSRWYPETLAARIRAIGGYAERITVRTGDAFDMLGDYIGPTDVAVFADPPYTAGGKRAGARLYRHWQVDHGRLFSLLAEHRGPLLATYDNCAEARRFAADAGLDVCGVAMRSTHHATLSELLIGNDLRWASTPPA